MITSLAAIRTRTAALAGRYRQLITSCSLPELIKGLKAAPRAHSAVYNNGENIEDGAAGALLFLIELYERSKEEELLAQIVRLCDELVDHCHWHPTNNYGLYTGRCGVVYVLLRLYALTKDHKLIESALALVADADGEYLSSAYTPDYLYNGRSGTLLTLTLLHAHAKDASLACKIERFVEAIVGNAILSDEGVSWKSGEELNLRNSCGMAFGAAGIQYALRLVNSYFPNPGLKYLIGQTGRYLDSCWLSDWGGWGNYEKEILSPETFALYRQLYKYGDEGLLQPARDTGWASGFTGVMASYLYKKAGVAARPPHDGDIMDGASLFNGRAGLGLYYLEAYNRHGEKELLDEATRIGSQLLEDQEGREGLAGGLFHGGLGAAYFLLRAADPKKTTDNILIPCARLMRKGETAGRDLPLRVSGVRKALTAGYFKRTIGLMELVAPKVLDGFFEGPETEDGELAAFTRFIEGELTTDTPMRPVLEDLFALERGKHHYIYNDQRTNLEIYLAQSFHHDESIRQLNNDDGWLMDQLLVVAPYVEIRNTRWEWVRWETYNILENLHLPPQRYEYLFLPSSAERVTEYPLKIDGLILHFFDAPRRAGDAIVEIRAHCARSSEAELKEFINNTGSENVDDFLTRLEFLVSQKVKQLIYDWVLVFR